MSQDISIKIDGITGESQDEKHLHEIDVGSWHWKMSQQSTMLSGSGGGAGKATVEDLVFVHQFDRASPNLMTYCLTGRPIPKAVLTMRKAGGFPLDFLKITMTDVIITGVEPSASGGGGYEQISLSFSAVKQEYMMQDSPGDNGGVVTGTFNIKGNAPS
jgi:type VI secretion system secreted protein Hcp